MGMSGWRWYVGVALGAAWISTCAACIPTLGRTNAKLESGFDVAFSAGGHVLSSGQDELEAATDTEAYPQGELDLQLGHRSPTHNAGVAAQLRVPASLIFTTLDLYLELPSQAPLYYGVGFEIGLYPGAYATITTYLNQHYYVTVTARALHVGSDEEAARDQWMLSPQLSVGSDAAGDLALTFSYARTTGTGIDIGTCFDECESPYHDYRSQFFLVAASARF